MKNKILILVALTVVLVGVLGLLLLSKDPTPTQQLTVDEKLIDSLEQGLSLRYREPLAEQALSQQDKEDKFILRLASQDPAMLVSVRYEDGLRAVTAVSKQELLPMLLSNA